MKGKIVSTEHICEKCKSRLAKARLVLAWAAVLPGVAGITAAAVALVDALKG